MLIFNRLRSHTLEWKTTGQGLPMSCEVKGSKTAGISLIAIGIFLLLTPLQLVIAAAPAASQKVAAMPSYLFSGLFAGLVIALVGIAEFLTRKYYTITPDYVECSRRGILPKSWKVPMVQYRDVIRAPTPSESTRESKKGTYCVALKHVHDRKKDVPLYVSRSAKDLDQKWMQFSELFSRLITDKRYDDWRWQ